VTDLPEYYDFAKRSRIFMLLRKINNRLVYRYLKRIDAFVLLTEQMKHPLNVGNRPNVIVEGIAAVNDRGYNNSYGDDKKIILYTGSLNIQSGIRDLLDAFNLIDDAGYELWIAGSGKGEDEIKRRIEVDSRIKYFGFVTIDQVYKLQSQATVLINPRKNEGEYTKYSFPSKTIEYMASGVPVLMYRLDGIPDEYDEYLTYIKGSSAESMAESITELCGKDIDELRQLGEKAKRFVLANKNPGKSAEKILNLIRDMDNQ